MNLTFIITLLIVGLTMVVGFLAGRSKINRSSVEEWSVGGRKLNALFLWFLVGADAYTAYTFLALTSMAYTGGSIAFYVLPYVLVAYFAGYFFLPRLWKVAKENRCTTLADLVKARFDSTILSTLVAAVSMLMLIPYIDLQLSGILDTVAVATNGAVDAKLIAIVCFVVVAFFTFFSGIKAPVYTGFIKDTLIWIVILVIAFTLPKIAFGGWGSLIDTVLQQKPALFLVPESKVWWIPSAGLISGIALFMWPHTVTGLFSTKSPDSIRKNMTYLGIYNIILVFVVLLGVASYFIVPQGTNPRLAFLLSITQLYHDPIMQGVFFAAIALGSLIPCSIMAIGASTLFANNIYRDLINPQADAKQIIFVSRYTVFVIIAVSLFVGLIYPTALISLQLAGVSGIVQIFPAVILSLYIKKLSKPAVTCGLIAGLITLIPLYMSDASLKNLGLNFVLDINSLNLYQGFVALIVNLVVLFIVNSFTQSKINDVTKNIFKEKAIHID